MHKPQVKSSTLLLGRPSLKAGSVLARVPLQVMPVTHEPTTASPKERSTKPEDKYLDASIATCHGNLCPLTLRIKNWSLCLCMYMVFNFLFLVIYFYFKFTKVSVWDIMEIFVFKKTWFFTTDHFKSSAQLLLFLVICFYGSVKIQKT